MLSKLKFKSIQNQPQFWYWVLFFATFIIGTLFTLYVAKAQDKEMRDNLTTYVKTIERSIDWQPFSAALNTQPEKIELADLAPLEVQLKNACKANRDCHFIYLFYSEEQQGRQQIKFLLDASPQPASEISQLADVFAEATDYLKQAMHTRQAYVEGPETDRWGTWVTAGVPVNITMQTPHFVMLNVDVAVKNWNQRVLKEVSIPIIATLMCLGVLLGFIVQNNAREKLLANMLDSSSTLFDLANNDALTGLPNRRLLEDRMLQAFNTADRAQHLVGVLFLDLDHFKPVNDTHGHFVGDQLLKSVANRLSKLQRKEDTVARIGGDEFVVLLPKIKGEQQAKAIAEKILSELAKPFSIENHSLQLGVSIGIAVYPKHQGAPHQLIKYADDAMYVAKRKGRNCYSIYAADFKS
jgi:diguanylate cyclase (GGDEF)-like protein